MIRGFVIIRMPVGMVPDNGYLFSGKRGIVAPAYRLVPRTILRCQLQIVSLTMAFPPRLKHRVVFGITINNMGLYRFVGITTNHVEIQIPLDFGRIGKYRDKIG